MQPIVRLSAIAAAIAATLAVAGCAEPPPPVIPTSQPSTAPVFATDADALAAAEKTYAGYQAASDAIGRDGGADSDRIAEWVTPSMVATEKKQFKSLTRIGDHLAGTSSFRNFRLQEIEQRAGAVYLTAYLCDDVTNSRVLDAEGDDVTPPARQGVIPVEVAFRNSPTGSARLLVEGSTVWTGRNFCAS